MTFRNRVLYFCLLNIWILACALNDSHVPPCYECAGNDLVKELEYIPPAVQCPGQCKCWESNGTKVKPECPIGVPTILDGCNCCWICARQSGELCSQQFLCDSSQQLDCFYEPKAKTRGNLVETQFTQSPTKHRRQLTVVPPTADAIGTCWKTTGRPCFINGTILAHSGIQRTGCRHQCMCVDGRLICVDLCLQQEMTERPPEFVCSRLAAEDRVPMQLRLLPATGGECCRRWVCVPSMEDEMPTDLPVSWNDSSQDSQPLQMNFNSDDLCTEARHHISPWSVCNQQCGLGVSSRWTTDTPDCRNITQLRLCFWRPCRAVNVVNSAQFVPTLKFIRPGYLRFTTLNADATGLAELSHMFTPPPTHTHSLTNVSPPAVCQLDRAFRPRFCNRLPSENTCCWPSRTTTRRLRFRCTGGQTVYHLFEWIHACVCQRKNCNAIFATGVTPQDSKSEAT
ncbi:unnamed protein product [Dicrocoelium dendriticum]|nr:unnamed protein product [Dicrocoelium dendriticum]